jgi:sulfotransferase family protein
VGSPGADDLDGLESRLAWILGGPRSGSTWLKFMCEEHPQVVTLEETMVGASLDPPMIPAGAMAFFEPRSLTMSGFSPDSWLFSPRYEDAWREPLRTLILRRISAQAGEAAAIKGVDAPVVVVKEPNSSHAAPVLMSLLKRARLVFLLRDGRDAVFSVLDGSSPGGWIRDIAGQYSPVGPAGRLEFIRYQSRMWNLRTQATLEAYEAHPPEKRLLLRYEDLRADPEHHLAELFDWLGLADAVQAAAAAAEQHRFERLPEDERGPGRFYRSATPGGWRDSGTPTERAVMEEVMGEWLERVGYEAGDPAVEGSDAAAVTEPVTDPDDEDPDATAMLAASLREALASERAGRTADRQAVKRWRDAHAAALQDKQREQAELANVQAQLAEARRALAERDRELDQARQSLDVVLQSRSWRWLAAARRLRAALRR